MKDKNQEKILQRIDESCRPGVEIIFLDFNIIYLLSILRITTQPNYLTVIDNGYIKMTEFIKFWQESQNCAVHPAIIAQIKKLPSKYASTNQWQTYYHILHKIVIKHYDIGYELQSKNEQIQQVASYLRIKQLLLNCLDVAYVNDRDAIIEKLHQIETRHTF